METTIINIKSGQPYDIYIGRANSRLNLPASKWANPYIIGKDGERINVIQKYKSYILNNPHLLNGLYEIDGKRLGCYCHPELCHGDVLISLRQSQRNEELKIEDIKFPALFDTRIKLAVIGSRTFTDKDRLYRILDKNKDKIKMVISGGAIGADSFSNDWCRDRGMPITIFYPDWSKGKGAGFQRNKLIIENSDKVLAFHDGISKGTLNSIEIAKELNIPYKVIVFK